MGLIDQLEAESKGIDAPEQVPETHKTSFNEMLGIINSGLPEGQRNTGLCKLGGLLRAAGLSRDVISGLLSSVNSSKSMGLSSKEIDTIARSVSRYSPKLENRLPQTNDIITIAQASEMFVEQKKRYGCLKTGFERYDKAISTFYPGEVLTIAGRSGTCKTTTGIEVSKRIAKELKGMCLFASLEMNPESVFFRMSNMEASRVYDKQFDAQDTNNYLSNSDLKERVIKEYGDKFLIINKDSLTLEQVENYYNIAKEHHSIPLILIDYLGYLNDAERGSTYDKVSRIARGVKGLAKRTGTRVILLCQTSREGKDGTAPVELHHLRDSGAIEESADYILGMWHSSIDQRLHCEVLKNRHGFKGVRFDFLNSGLNLIECDYYEEENEDGEEKTTSKAWGKRKGGVRA